MNEKEVSTAVYIMLLSVMKFSDKPTPIVSKVRLQILKGLKKHHLKAQPNTSIRVATEFYTNINDKVIEAWDSARRELIDPLDPMQSCMGAIVEHMWNRLNRNKYQEMYVTEKNMQRVINSYDGAKGEKLLYENELPTIVNSRKLADKFFDNMNIPKPNTLARRMLIQKQNLICENKVLKAEYL